MRLPVRIAFISLCVFYSNAKAVDFESAYQLMLVNNGEYQAALLNYKASQEEAKSATADYLPSIELRGNYGRTNESIETRNPEMEDSNPSANNSDGVDFENNIVNEEGSYNSGSASLDVTQPIFNKSLLSNIKRSKSLSKEAYLEWQELHENLVLRLLETYTSSLNAIDEYGILTKELEALDQHRQLTQKRHDQGLGNLTDLYESDSRYELVRAEQLNAKFDKDRFLLELEVFIGQKVDKVQPLFEKFQPVFDKNLPNFDLEKVSDNQVLLAEQKVKTAAHELQQRKSAFAPVLNLRAQSTYNTSDFSDVSSDQDRQTERVFLELEVPLFAGFGNVASVRGARHRLNAEKAVLLETKRDFNAEIITNNENYQTSYQRLKAFEKAYLSSQKALKLREKAFIEGLSSNLDLLDSVRSAFRAERSWRAALYGYINSKMALISSVREIGDEDIVSLNSFFKNQTVEEVPVKNHLKNSITAQQEKTVVSRQDGLNLAIIMGLTRSWAKAWSERNLDQYLAFYDDLYTPSNLAISNSEWRENRRKNLSNKTFIRVFLKDIVVEQKGNQVMVSFEQVYESSSWNETSQKQLVFARNSDSWKEAKIIQEKQLDE